jgi:hypothetical protein
MAPTASDVGTPAKSPSLRKHANGCYHLAFFGSAMRQRRAISAGRCFAGTHSQGSKACRSASAAADQVRVGGQSQDGQGTRSPCAGQAARARRPGDRIGALVIGPDVLFSNGSDKLAGLCSATRCPRSTLFGSSPWRTRALGAKLLPPATVHGGPSPQMPAFLLWADARAST